MCHCPLAAQGSSGYWPSSGPEGLERTNATGMGFSRCPRSFQHDGIGLCANLDVAIPTVGPVPDARSQGQSQALRVPSNRTRVDSRTPIYGRIIGGSR